MSAAEAPGPATEAKTKGPVVIIHDIFNYETGNDDRHKKKRAKTTSGNDNNDSESKRNRPKILRPESNKLLEDMLYPLPEKDFLQRHFRRNAVCIQREPRSRSNHIIVSDICSNYLFDLDVRQIFAETSSENVFLWLSSPSSDATAFPTTTTATANSLNSVEISDPETAHALYVSGSHPAYCRAPPTLEQRLVGSLLRATGLGCGHYHPPHTETVTLGGGTTLGRGEVELFVGAAAPPAPRGGGGSGDEVGNNRTTGWHTDFQENFTIQLSGVKRWTLRRGRIRHPLRATTPHYARDASVVENQLKVARLSCLGENTTVHQCGKKVVSAAEIDVGAYGFEYGENNAYGPEQTVTLCPGDVLYFPSGMWHRVESVEPGVSLNVSLMGTNYATLVCEALRHLMVGRDEGWREVVASRPGEEGGALEHLRGMLGGLSRLVDDFVTKQGGAQSLLPPALCHPPLGPEEEEGPLEGEDGDDINNDCDSDEEENQSSKDETSGPLNERMEGNDEENQSSTDERSGSVNKQIMKDESDDEEEEDVPSSGIIIPIDDFKGSSGWTCERPSDARLIKNPLASLISMTDIAGFHQQHRSLDGNVDNADNHDEMKKRYILNVNFAGNEMMESHIRVILETSNPKSIDLMDWYLECEAQGQNPGNTFMQNSKENGFSDGNNSKHTPPLCLFYYGYFSWGNERSTFR
mmetsp:Transcript_16452/g.35758  ORF Transcript_16452/g.35758 Transcript_16452/m.35758 type:complete len:694 (+) Transcript_16452:49-2130(+)|eukprot:CAMPEP_0172542138 /NCGR_PEP_ID=MMETSP1067-20121228/12799_1 /TAXON_ID=265564 ORGANISM="Thalassiosira punctigera, Strain Tpunct2005C2" /NCGR_SAMPLE_ID=MMETSP1067 /ASSEMBLY_ACC=CAM_ASM_000444 /LENGTH=693 /DNA_ID=CAMNT_0013328305 /DNA_START=39 /DNA_END=2120 /DNA_ORIENTATION=-